MKGPLRLLKDVTRPMRTRMREARIRRKPPFAYSIEGAEILLPFGHQLPTYQRDCPLYDRFLPHLCRALSDEGWVVDVGANAGDTAAAIAQSCKNHVLAVEGSEYFYRMLKQNAARLRPGVIAVHALVGTPRAAGDLVVQSGSTATRRGNAASVQPTTTLDALLEQNGVTKSSLALIKIDTDGYDGDVILSGQRALRASLPLLYWENQFRTAAQLSDLELAYTALDALGYSAFWVFDNFGGLMASEVDLKAVRDLNRYVQDQNDYGATRTIGYTDILGSTPAKVALAREGVGAFHKWVHDPSRQAEL